MSLLYCEYNGQHQVDISPLNRGLAYGDGVFTTAKVSQGEIEYLPEHIERLTLACQSIGLSLPPNDLNSQLITAAKPFDLAVLKVTITAGEGGRGYSRAQHNPINILITVHEFPSHYQTLAREGIHLGIAETKLGVNPQLAGIKHLNRLEQVLIKQELDRRVEQELLVLSCLNDVIEVSAGNVFFYMADEDTWHTPILEQAGVNGLIRQQLLKRLDNSKTSKMTMSDVHNATEVFVCNSLMGIVPVNKFMDKPLAMDNVIKTKQELAL